ncbi:hypothetical protein ACFL37_01050 [Candidatus Margulisiibacteriota bacterium]
MAMAGTIQAGKPIKTTEQSSGVDNRYINLKPIDIENYKSAIAKSQTFEHERSGRISLKQREAIAAQASAPQAADLPDAVPLMNFDNPQTQQVQGPAISLAKATHGKESVLLTLDALRIMLPEARETIDAAQQEAEMLWEEQNV